VYCDNSGEFAQANAVREKPRPPSNRVGDVRLKSKHHRASGPFGFNLRLCIGIGRDDPPNRPYPPGHRLEYLPLAPALLYFFQPFIGFSSFQRFVQKSFVQEPAVRISVMFEGQSDRRGLAELLRRIFEGVGRMT
jgi:hypothetical protein